MIAVVAAVILTLIVTDVFRSTPERKEPDVTQFARLMKKGVNSAYVATYYVTNYVFFQTGSIVVANVPPRPGTKVPVNVNDYSSAIETSYVFRGENGHIVQWIQDRTSVSACVNGLPSSGNGLQCSRPFQYDPSNGFAEESIGFVPEYVLQSFQSFNSLFTSALSRTFTESSRQFGALRCIRQVQVHVKTPERDTTCLNRNGILVSWTSQNPGGTTRVRLSKLSLHPTKKNFTTLRKPTKTMILPPF